MVPAAVVPLPALPLTPNGKIDRAALPAAEPRRGAAALPPRTPVEMVIAEVWAEILDADGFGVHDDFFSLGGHSLNASRLASRLRQVLGVEIPLGVLFRHPTVAGFAAALLDDPARRARVERAAEILAEMEDDEDEMVEEARGAVP
jgi:acyl carrier protein